MADADEVHSTRPVVLVTDDFRLYHDAVPLFRAAGIDLLGIAPGDDIPPAALVVLDGPPDDPRSEPVAADPESTLLRVLWRLDPRTPARSDEAADAAPAPAPYRRVVIGIDPGATWGLALLADGHLMQVAEAHDPAEVTLRVARWLAAVPARGRAIHIGDGDREHALPLLVALRDVAGDAWISLVPEHHTTPHKVQTLSRHTDAAVRIALREPHTQPF